MDGSTGMVVLASNTVTKRYWHAGVPLVAAPARGMVTVGASGTATSTTAVTDVTVARPAGVATGDVLVAEINADKNPTMASVPPGWTPVVPPLGVHGLATTFVYARVVTDAAVEPASYRWQLSNAQKWNAGTTAFRGMDNAAPFDTPASTAVDPSVSATGLTVPGVTTVTLGAMVVGGVGPNSTSAAVAPPTGWTESFEATTAQVAELAHQSRPTAGGHRGRPLDVQQGRRRRRVAARTAPGRAGVSGVPRDGAPPDRRGGQRRRGGGPLLAARRRAARRRRHRSAAQAVAANSSSPAGQATASGAATPSASATT
ncbi:hypothetical protein [Geodermatophilus maliterrae]|uniref:Uncharacterized protein n=1 Tax=Geodermatophilus maliterrae TaxID=3162531 RepID=A0ABV3XAL1_9ACTN